MGKIKGFLFAVRHREILMTDLGLNEKDCFCEALHCLFWTVMLQVVENQRFDANRLKLTNFESKISLCVQLAVLSDGKCKYCIALNCNVAL